MSRLIDIENERNCVSISFPYEPTLVDLVRTFPERFYDRQKRVWYVPLQHLGYVLQQLDDHHFKLSPSLRRYCDENDDDVAEAPQPAAPPIPDGSYTISRLNQAARQALRQAFDEEIWLVAELQDFDKNGAANYRTYFFDLVERPYAGATEVARIKAVLFDDPRRGIENKLERSGSGIRLRDGLAVHLKGRIDLYAQSGRYQIVITDIDPAYTTGEIELNRERILRELRRLGLHEKNIRLPWPTCPLRIGLITSYESDAYNDFIHQLELSSLGFDVTVHHAQVQGQHTEASVLRALSYFADRAEDFDLVAIVRGGGSRSDLAYFDTMPIGRAVCEHPLKIVCGVGHQRDQCLLDAIAYST
ncbi:MAG: exodeoxyribonuclease VII large subunit, partial [Bradymonadaceae bacterium]